MLPPNATALMQGARRVADALPPSARAGFVGVLQLLASIAAVAVVVPLRGLYFNGPTLGGYGFWGGAEPPDICAQITGMSATVWLASPTTVLQCESLLERKFTSFAWSVFAAAYLWMLYNLAAHLWYRYCVLRPAMAEFRHALLGADAQLVVRRPANHTPPNYYRRHHLVWRTPTPPKPRPPPDDD